MRMQGVVSLRLNGKAPHQRLTDKVRMIRPSTLAMTMVQGRKSTPSKATVLGCRLRSLDYTSSRAQEHVKASIHLRHCLKDTTSNGGHSQRDSVVPQSLQSTTTQKISPPHLQRRKRTKTHLKNSIRLQSVDTHARSLPIADQPAQSTATRDLVPNRLVSLSDG